MAPEQLRLTTPLALALLASVSVLSAACGEGGQGTVAQTGSIVPTSGQCLVTFSMVAGAGVKSSTFDIDHTDVAGAPVTDGPSSARCEGLLDSGFVNVAFNPREHCSAPSPPPDCNHTLTLSVVQDYDHLIDAPVEITRCLFEMGANPPPVAEEFEFTHVQSVGPDIWPIEPPPVLAVTSVDCSASPTSSSSTTSTTVAGCDGATCATNEACIEGQCVTTSFFEIEFSLTDEINLGALSVEIGYAVEQGAFVGVRQDVACTRNSSINGLFQANHIVAARYGGGPFPVVYLGFVAPAGFDGPTWLVRCVFESVSGMPTAEDFDVEMTEASTVEIVPMYPAIEITRIRAVESPY